MKTGLSLQDMAKELERRNAAKRDFIADTRSLNIAEVGHVQLALPNAPTLDLTEGEVFREQALAHYKVPREYADRIRVQHPALYANTLNTFFREAPTRRMVRVLDNNARAFLSDRYRPLDNHDLADAVLPELMRHASIRVESTQFTERRFYLKAVLPKIETEVKVGDPVQIGLVVSNSEVGAGALHVMPLVYRLFCKNGMIAQDYGQRRYHVGKRASSEESAFELYSEGTRRLDDAAFFAKVRDTVRGVLTHDVLERLVVRMREATQQEIESLNLPAVVEMTAQMFGYTQSTQHGILKHLIQGGDLTRYGLMNAITRQSQDEEDYEVATRMETDGSRVIELPKDDWKTLAEAA